MRYLFQEARNIAHFPCRCEGVMKAIVTISYAVLLVDSDALSFRTIHSGSSIYYGITRHDGNIVVAARGRLAIDAISPADERGFLLFFSTSGSNVAAFKPNIPLRDLHGIENVDGRIYCCSSFDNAIAICRQGDSTYWHPLGKPSTEPYDFNHIKCDDRFIYILAHNWGRGSEIFTISQRTLKIKKPVKIGQQAHSIWFDDKQMRTFSSAESKVIGLDGLNVDVGGFPRGYASDDIYRSIGISENVIRSKRDKSNASVIITDMDYKTLNVMDLGQFGMVLDIAHLEEDEFRKLEGFGVASF